MSIGYHVHDSPQLSPLGLALFNPVYKPSLLPHFLYFRHLNHISASPQKSLLWHATQLSLQLTKHDYTELISAPLYIPAKFPYRVLLGRPFLLYCKVHERADSTPNSMPLFRLARLTRLNPRWESAYVDSQALNSKDNLWDRRVKKIKCVSFFVCDNVNLVSTCSQRTQISGKDCRSANVSDISRCERKVTHSFRDIGCRRKG